MTTQPEFEGERASGVENGTLSETVPSHQTHAAGRPSSADLWHGWFLSFIDIGNTDQ